MLAAVPELVDQLNVAASKQAKISTGGKAGKGTAHLKEPINWGAAAARDALLVEWALWHDSLEEIRRHPKAAEIVAGIGRAVKNGYQAIDRAAHRQYLGTCEANDGDGAVCHAELWIKPGAHQVTCTQCETTRSVSERREWLLEQADDMIFTPREASQYVGDVGGFPVGQQRIRNYIDRKRIPNRPAPDGTMRLRLGDLRDLLRREALRREKKSA